MIVGGQKSAFQVLNKAKSSTLKSSTGTNGKKLVKKSEVKAKPSKATGSSKVEKPTAQAVQKMTDRERVNKYLECVKIHKAKSKKKVINEDHSHLGGSTGFQYFVKRWPGEKCRLKYFADKAEHEVTNMVNNHKARLKHEAYNAKIAKERAIYDEKWAKRKKIFKIIAVVTFVPKMFVYGYFGYRALKKMSKNTSAASGTLLDSNDLIFTGNFAQQMIPLKPSLQYQQVINLTDQQFAKMRDWKEDKQIL